MATVPVHWLVYRKMILGCLSDVLLAMEAGMKIMSWIRLGRRFSKDVECLPLVIVALGSLMQFKSSESDWLYVRDSEIWDLPDDGTTILPALRLTYDNSHSQLRRCFAYCCIFPKGTKMEKDTLIELWIANGFISSEGERSLHDVGHQTCNELVWRSFVQEVDKSF